MEISQILYEVKDSILTIKLNRPDKLNALNISMISKINDVLNQFEKDNNVHCLIITGTGDKAFAAGVDIEELKRLTSQDAKQFSEYGQSVFNKIENYRKPVIALINGYALGGGFELSLACHIRLCSENAKMGLPELDLGVIPGYGGTQRLSRKINSGRALYYILSGEKIESEDAYRLGIVSSVHSSMNLFEKGLELAKKIAAKPVEAVTASLHSVMFSERASLLDGLAVEASQFALCYGTDNFYEGTSAFLEKRKPGFNKK